MPVSKEWGLCMQDLSVVWLMDEMCGDDPGPKARVRPNRALRPCLKEPGEGASCSPVPAALLLAMAVSMSQLMAHVPVSGTSWQEGEASPLLLRKSHLQIIS